ncbi:MAG: NUDIX domain-containing protein [Candidatus Buchananbacteria bacterium]
MERGKTIGIVIFKKDGKSIKYLLLHRGGDYWTFPKGRPEGLENEIETALREVQEETGITEVKIIEGFRQQYDYDFDTQISDGVKEKIYQTAVLFLGEVGEVEVKISDEHVDYGWFDYDMAHQRLFIQNNQNVLRIAHQTILKNEDFVL